MQPNQQNQSPEQAANNYTSSTGAPIPEYLHMDPPADPAVAYRSRKRKRIAVLVLVFIIIVSAIGAAAFWYMEQNTPQARLYRVIDKHLQVKYAQRTTDIKKSQYSAKVTSESDFTDPKQAKSKVRMSTDGGAGTEMETVILSSKEYALSIKSVASGAIPRSMVKNEWYRVPFHAASRDEVGYWVDTVYSPLLLNSVQGILPMGSFSDDQRVALIDYMRANNIYEVTGAQMEGEGDSRSTKYSVQIDLDKVNALNSKIVTLLGLPQQLTIQKPYPAYQEVIIWVNESSGELTKMTYNSGENKNSLDIEKSTTFVYPEELSIKAPSGLKDLPE